mmetsp:Transcript_19879/g.60297  ORF Transcript_19879/g.60297 Transcript_19879/m.60297 type:complete len:140 (+) Transcript_19879:170-589(+)|eukprot:scaffold50_cov30-Tisochrysis_lutea.AAC.1
MAACAERAALEGAAEAAFLVRMRRGCLSYTCDASQHPNCSLETIETESRCDTLNMCFRLLSCTERARVHSISVIRILHRQREIVRAAATPHNAPTAAAAAMRATTFGLGIDWWVLVAVPTGGGNARGMGVCLKVLLPDE